MSSYFDNGKEILRILLDNGYESFLTGPFIRDYVISKESHETLEIITPSVYETWVNIFGQNRIRRLSQRQSVLTFEENYYILSTFRQESKLSTVSINDNSEFMSAARVCDDKDRLQYELSQRTFTVDALCYDATGRLRDMYGGYEDIGKKAIKFICDPFKAYEETPILFLETARLMSVLGFEPTKETWAASKKCAEACAKISNLKDLIVAMKFILNGPYASEGLRYLIKTKAYKYIQYFGPELLRLYDNTAALSFDEFVLRIFVSNKEINETVLAETADPVRVCSLFNEIMDNPKSKFTLRSVCHYGLDDALLCDSLTQLMYNRPSHRLYIKLLHHKLCLKKEDSFVITEKEILDLVNHVNIAPKISAHDLYETLLKSVMLGELNNNAKDVSDKALAIISQYAQEHAQEHALEHAQEHALEQVKEHAQEQVQEHALEHVIEEEQSIDIQENSMVTNTDEADTSMETIEDIKHETDEEWIERTAQNILNEFKNNGVEITEEIKNEAYKQAEMFVLESKNEVGATNPDEEANDESTH